MNYCTLLFVLLSFVCSAQTNNEKVNSFINSINSSIDNNDPTVLNEILKNEKFALRVFHSKAAIQKNTNLLTTIHNDLKFGNVILNDVSTSGLYEFLEHRIDDQNQHRVLFRIFSYNGLNYHEYLLAEDETKSFIVEDIFISLTGDYISETLHSNLKVLLGSQFSNEEEMALHKEYYTLTLEVSDAIQSGQYDKALLASNLIKPEYHSEKLFINNKLKILGATEEGAYENYLEELIKKDLFPEVSVRLLILENHYLKVEYKELLAVIDSIENNIIKDPIFNFYRAYAHLKLNNFSEAKTLYEKLKVTYPMKSYGYSGLLLIEISKPNFGDFWFRLDNLIHNFIYSKEELSYMLSDYPDFLESEVFKYWLKANKDNLSH